MESQKGIYALLLGSGVSRSAAVPTGWEITIDLVERVAREAGGHCAGEEAISWYIKRYGQAPDYSRLLHAIAGLIAISRS